MAKDDKEKAKENLRKALLEFVPEEDAAPFVDQIAQYSELRTVEDRGKDGGDGQGFEPGRAPDLSGLRRETLDLAKFLVEAGEDRLVDTSEIPSALLMHVVRVMSEDEICAVGFTGSPVAVVIRNFLKCMIARDRKRVKEVVELFQSSMDKMSEDMFQKGGMGL